MAPVSLQLPAAAESLPGEAETTTNVNLKCLKRPMDGQGSQHEDGLVSQIRRISKVARTGASGRDNRLTSRVGLRPARLLLFQLKEQIK
jgi:hypothetical protein